MALRNELGDNYNSKHLDKAKGQAHHHNIPTFYIDVLFVSDFLFFAQHDSIVKRNRQEHMRLLVAQSSGPLSDKDAEVLESHNAAWRCWSSTPYGERWARGQYGQPHKYYRFSACAKSRER